MRRLLGPNSFAEPRFALARDRELCHEDNRCGHTPAMSEALKQPGFWEPAPRVEYPELSADEELRVQGASAVVVHTTPLNNSRVRAFCCRSL